MKIKCSYCHSKIEFDEKEYTPGEEVSVECRRCGEETKVTIPTPEEEIQEKDGNSYTYVTPIVESTTSSKESTVSYPINPPTVSESQRVNNRPKSPEKPLQEQQDLSLQPTSEIQHQQPTETNELYFGIPKGEEKVSSQPPRKTIPKKPHAHTRKPQNETVPPISTNTQNVDSNGGCANWIIIIFLVMLVGLCIWLFRSCGSDTQESMQVKVDTVYIEKEEPEYIEEIEDVVFDTEPVDTIEVAAAEIVEAPSDQSEISKIYLPSVSAYTSSEAYNVYPSYITEEKFGDAWATSNVVQQAIVNGDVEYFVKGEGDIEGYPLSIDAVRLKNGRLYGRYHNDYNGVKLDINGAFDSNGDIIIKLGHKSETSYWILKSVGKTEDGSLQYKGTWGRKDKPTTLKIKIKDN